MARTTLDASKNRLIDLDTSLGKDDLVVESLTGTESLGRLFEYEIFALSTKSNINFDDLLGHHLSVGFEMPGGFAAKRRFLDGRVARVSLVGMSGELFRYRVILRPWTWMLTRTADCKIFQKKTVPQIIEDVFADQPDQDHVLSLNGNYGIREYCVQYRETDFNFISRLMEEEGIYTFFRHEKGKHTLVICDAIGAHKSVGDIPFFPQDRVPREGQDVIRDWSVTREIQTGATAMRDYNFEKPSVDLTVTRSQERPHSESAHEVFDYPGEYLEPPEGEHLVRTRLEELQTAHERVEGSGTARAIACGGLFTLTGFARSDQNREYLVVSTYIDATNNLFETGTTGGAEFSCRFESIPAKDAHYRTPRTTGRPIVQGPQTAVVVGPSGEEIHVDTYGRVKLQFHWDRLGKHDDKSSCWVRVSQAWAGKNYGWVTLPRIGQEVIVDFLEGDADKPIVTGRVHNAEQMPPYKLPDNKTQSGILTRSSKGGSPANANELRFEDKKGEEQVYFHAEKDMSIHVENDASRFVGHDDSTVVMHDASRYVDHDDATKVKHDYSVTVGNNGTVGMVGTRVTTVNGKVTNIYNAGKAEKVTAGSDEFITVHHFVDVDGWQHNEIHGVNSSHVTGNAEDKVDGDVMQMATNFKYTASADFEFFGSKFNRTVMEANDTFLGANTSTYIGASSSTEVSGARSTFIGTKNDLELAIALGTTLGLKSSLEASLSISATLGPQISFAVLGLKDKPVDMAKAAMSIDTQAMKIINGGGPGGPGAGAAAAAAAGPVAAAIGLSAAGGAAIQNAIAAFKDISEFPSVSVSAVLSGMAATLGLQNTAAFGGAGLASVFIPTGMTTGTQAFTSTPAPSAGMLSPASPTNPGGKAPGVPPAPAAPSPPAASTASAPSPPGGHRR